jgi:hypothetical protein
MSTPYSVGISAVALRVGVASATAALAFVAACGDMAQPDKAQNQDAKNGGTEQAGGTGSGTGGGTTAGGTPSQKGGQGSDTKNGISSDDMIIGKDGKPKPSATPTGTTGGAPDPRPGAIVEVNVLGHAFGWAVDKTNTALQIDVEFYLDGPKGSGTMLGTVHAGSMGASGNNPGQHRWDFDLPGSAKDGHAHTLYLYAAGGALLDANPTSFTAYAGTTAGRNYFQASVAPKVTECNGCHQMSYDFAFPLLLAPTPAKGGTKTNNILMQKPLQMGVQHGGGTKCASAASSPCAEFQQWWTAEFGSL